MKYTLSVNELIKIAVSRLRDSGIENPYLDASVLLSCVLGMRREYLLLEPERKLNNPDIVAFNEFVERRCKNEPIAYIIGKKEFWSLDFTVTRDTLIPRPDSETLVEAALKRAKNIAHERIAPLTSLNIGILDIGTGTACLLIALLKELPAARGLGVDISEPALQVAGNNAKNHGVDGRVRFAKSNWCDEVNGQFDLIISNPPYIPRGDLSHLMKDVADYEPYLALISGLDGMDSYRAISQQIYGKLKNGGYVLFEIGQGQDVAVASLLQEANLVIDEISNDLAGVPRCVIAKKMN